MNVKDSDHQNDNQKSEEKYKTQVKQNALNGLTSEEFNKDNHISDLNKTMKLLDINPEDMEEIEHFDEENGVYFRNDPKYKEINNYIIGEELGEGMFAIIKEVVHKISLKRLAAKIINMDRIAKKGQKYVDNINVEIDLVRRLNNKNVIKFLDYFCIGFKHYLIMEYCCAVLDEYLKTEPKKLPKSQSHFYFCQLIDGLDYLHSYGIIHRDIKPSNILITNSNQLKIADFGVLSPFCESDILESVEGSPYYQAPEVFKVKEYSGTKYDIWSSGVTLFEMISGRVPFQKNFYESITTDDIDYPEDIFKDKTLLNLLQEIFIKDFNRRININAIKRHDWFIAKHSQKDFRKISDKNSEDLYRSLTVLPYIQNHLYPLNIDENRQVSRDEFEESCKRTPLIRSTRIKTSRRGKNNVSPFRRSVRIGLIEKSKENR